MTDIARPSRYGVASDDDGEAWGVCHEVDELFAEPQAAQEWRHLRFVACDPEGLLRKHCASGSSRDRVLGNAEIQVLDAQGRPVGAYFAATLTLTKCQPNPENPSLYDVTADALLLSPPSPAAEPIWEIRRAGGPARTNEWADGSTAYREAWLHVARLHHRWNPRQPDLAAGHRFELDGAHTTDEPGFYCALGEAINGPGGYFGAGLDSLRDCLRGGFGALSPFALVWRDAEVAHAHVASIPKVLRELDLAGLAVTLT